jgi:hypothetical protein
LIDEKSLSLREEKDEDFRDMANKNSGVNSEQEK